MVNFGCASPLLSSLFRFLFALLLGSMAVTAYSKVIHDPETNRNELKTDHDATATILYTFTTNNSLPNNLIQGLDGNFYGTTVHGGTNDFGTLFRITPQGQHTTLHSFFDSTDGAFPNDGLFQSHLTGSVYGTTRLGGANNNGTLFIYEPNGSPSIKTAFSFKPNPFSIFATGVVEASAGIFVGATGQGGAYNRGSLYLYISNKVSGETVHSFYGEDGELPSGGLVADRQFVYGTTMYGGTGGLGTVFKFDRSNFKTLHSFQALSDGALPQTGVLIGKDGNLYGTTMGSDAQEGTWPGQTIEGTIFKLNPTDESLTTIFSFGKETDEKVIHPFSKLIQGTDGNFYGTTFNGGKYGGGYIYKVTPAGIQTTLYSFHNNSEASSLIQGNDGDLYGISPRGGVGGTGTFFKISLHGI